MQYFLNEINFIDNSEKGFTLIEIVIVMVIISLLFLFAIPSYQNYLKRQHRISCQSAMLQIATDIERQMLYLGNYADVVKQSFANTIQCPSDVDIPTHQIKVIADGATFEIVATPQNNQVDDGRLTYDSFGKQCWYRGFDTQGGKCETW